MQFSASTSLRSGLTLSSAPQSPDITRLLNVSLSSTEQEFERDLQTQLWELTSREKIITDSGSFIIYFPLACTVNIYFQSQALYTDLMTRR